MNDILIGPSVVLVYIDNPKNPDALLWRPINNMIHVGEAIGYKVAWSKSKVFVEKDNAASFVSSHDNVTSRMSGRPTPKSKYKLIDVDGT